jgi:hypothetical protein
MAIPAKTTVEIITNIVPILLIGFFILFKTTLM